MEPHKSMPRIRLPQASNRAKTMLGALLWLVVSGCAGMSQSGRIQDPAAQSKIVLIPDSVNFGNVVTGQKNTQTLKISNQDSKTIDITSAHVSGSGMSIIGLAYPFSLQPQGSRTFTLQFAPTATGTVQGAIALTGTIAVPAVNIQGVGAAPREKLQTDPTSINFGKLKVKGSATQKVVVTNTGNVMVSVDQAVLSGPGFAVSDLAAHFELAPQQETSFLVSFSPQIKGAAVGALKFHSKQLSSPLVVSLAGEAVDGNQPQPASGHVVRLGWNASPGNITGYYVYRGEVSGGPYNRLDSSLVKNLEYADSSVDSGKDYFYVITSVDHEGNQSVYSQQISVQIPTP